MSNEHRGTAANDILPLLSIIWTLPRRSAAVDDGKCSSIHRLELTGVACGLTA
jgi:hypothetical protein